MTNTPNDKSTHNFTKQTKNLSVVLCLGMLAGVLIWAKLRLVTDIPRSAYADPRELDIPDVQDAEPEIVIDAIQKNLDEDQDIDSGLELVPNPINQPFVDVIRP